MEDAEKEVDVVKKEFPKETIRCPICNSNSINNRCRYNDMHIYKCRHCDMMFQNPISALVSQNKFANDMYMAGSFSNLKLRLTIASKTLKRIRPWIEKGFPQLKVLEIGIGSGAIGLMFTSEGAFYRGVEPSSFMYKQTIKNFPKLSDKIQNCFLQDADLPKRYFDLAVMVDTLEHIPYPIDFLELLKTYLREGGIIYIEVPNESLLRYKGYLRRLLCLYSGYPTHPGHVNLFAIKTLKKTLNLADVDILKVCQLTVLGDCERMKLVFGGKTVVLTKFICNFFAITKLDIAFRQGNIVAISRKTRI